MLHLFWKNADDLQMSNSSDTFSLPLLIVVLDEYGVKNRSSIEIFQWSLL